MQISGPEFTKGLTQYLGFNTFVLDIQGQTFCLEKSERKIQVLEKENNTELWNLADYLINPHPPL